MKTRQFERTFIFVDERSSVTYIEGCTTPFYDTNHLHATVVGLYCTEGAMIKYSNVKNWYVGDEECRCRIYNFITKIGLCDGDKLTQAENNGSIQPTIGSIRPNNHPVLNPFSNKYWAFSFWKPKAFEKALNNAFSLLALKYHWKC